MSGIIALSEAQQALKDRFGGDVIICLQPEHKDSKAIAALPEDKRQGLWCTDLFGDSPRPAMRADRKFFDVMFLTRLTYPQPAIQEEPGKVGEHFVGPTYAAIVVKDGVVYCLVVDVDRPIVGLKCLELPRKSLSNAAVTIGGSSVGDGGFANTARINGRIEDRYEQVDPNAMDAVATALRRLTPEQREAIELRFFAGLSAREAAEAMGRQEGTIRGLQFRAIAALRRELGVKSDADELGRVSGTTR